MKTTLPLLLLLLAVCPSGYGQITTPVIRANFGVDGELRCNYNNTNVQSGNDDWFFYPGSSGTGNFIIDTTGAAALLTKYSTNVAARRQPFYRTMRFPGYTVINNRLLLDAVFIRDYHGDDSTVFASGANKNGDSPVDWSCPISQGIPDKNDILDMMVHVRRAGPSKTDSLWMFGGLSLDNTTGNRYLDFEMYQTDIYYDRGTRQFYGYGPFGGHTVWEFDAAGNITVPGDIIFSAEYQSSSLSNIEARIWVNRKSLAITPVSFDWSGQFDGAGNGADFGYASIRPKGAGTYYTGLQCPNNTWGGPFGIVLQDDDLQTNYEAKQYVEFSVNLTKLGLDPVTLLGSNSCGMPFRRVLVKTRASASFTAELKDFVGPFDLFLAPRVQATTTTPLICNGSGVAQIDVVSPVSTSVYQWTTLDGTIISNPKSATIYVNKPGTCIVTQYLQEDCSAYASDTIQVLPLQICEVMGENNVYNFRGATSATGVGLSWQVQDNRQVNYFEVQKSSDGIKFATVGQVKAQPSALQSGAYAFQTTAVEPAAFYRIKLINADGLLNYSTALRLSAVKNGYADGLQIYPNPVKNKLQVQVPSPAATKMNVALYDASGNLVLSSAGYAQQGNNLITLEDVNQKATGICLLVVKLGSTVYQQKIIVAR